MASPGNGEQAAVIIYYCIVVVQEYRIEIPAIAHGSASLLQGGQVTFTCAAACLLTCGGRGTLTGVINQLHTNKFPCVIHFFY